MFDQESREFLDRAAAYRDVGIDALGFPPQARPAPRPISQPLSLKYIETADAWTLSPLRTGNGFIDLAGLFPFLRANLTTIAVVHDSSDERAVLFKRSRLSPEDMLRRLQKKVGRSLSLSYRIAFPFDFIARGIEAGLAKRLKSGAADGGTPFWRGPDRDEARGLLLDEIRSHDIDLRHGGDVRDCVPAWDEMVHYHLARPA